MSSPKRAACRRATTRALPRYPLMADPSFTISSSDVALVALAASDTVTITLTGLSTVRSRPLCAYPKTVRYTGEIGGDSSVASNYSCQ